MRWPYAFQTLLLTPFRPPEEIGEVLYAQGSHPGDYTDRRLRTIKDSPLRLNVKSGGSQIGRSGGALFHTPGGTHDSTIVIEAKGPEPINKLMSSVQSLGNVKITFVGAFSIEEMRKMV